MLVGPWSLEAESRWRLRVDRLLDFLTTRDGHGNDYKTVQKQRYTKQDLRFEFLMRVREGKNGQPNFLGSFAQGPANNRFIYLDIGTYAEQTNTPWSRRLKIPLTGITWPMIEQASDAST